MKEILDIYINLPDKEQEFFKELLNDILLSLKFIEKNKNKKSIKQLKIEEYNRKMLNLHNTILEKFSKDIDISNIQMDLSNIFYWKNFSINHKMIFLPIYKWERTDKNNFIFVYRRDFINLLNQYNLVYISDFNISRELKIYKEERYDKEFQPLIDLFENTIEQQRKEYWSNLINQDLEKLETLEKELELIIFKEKDIINLLENFENIDSKKIIYKNRTLMYNWKFYSPSKDSKRDRFLELFFTWNKKKYLKKEIINYLQFDFWNFYNSKTLKILLDLYKWLNKKIEKELWIKKLFYLWKWDYKDYIYIKS